MATFDRISNVILAAAGLQALLAVIGAPSPPMTKGRPLRVLLPGSDTVTVAARSSPEGPADRGFRLDPAIQTVDAAKDDGNGGRLRRRPLTIVACATGA